MRERTVTRESSRVFVSVYVITSLPAYVFPIFLDGQSLKKKRELIKGKGACWVTKGGQMTLSLLLLFPADYRSLHATVQNPSPALLMEDE